MIWLVVSILILLVVLSIALVPVYRINRQEYERTGKHPEGYYISTGIALGLVLGIPFGLALDNVALGPAIGLPIGLAIGSSLEKRNADKLRPRNEREERVHRWTLVGLIALALAGVVAFVATLLLATG